LIGSLQNTAVQSTNLPKPEKRSVVTHSPAPQEQAVTLLGAFSLERSRDNFGIRSHGIIERTASGSKLHSLPQSNVETYKKLRAADLKYMLPRVLAAKNYQGQGVIGPYQVEGSRIWFGNQYYDSEGDAA
jgi:hypothetical protein